MWESRIPELGLELRSAFTDGRAADDRVEHLLLAQARVDVETTVREPGWPPLLSRGQGGLLSHLLRLQELLQQCGHNARISQPDRILVAPLR